MPSARELRVKLDIPQEELAKRAGVSYRTIHRWEKGEAVRRDIALKIAGALGVDLDTISGVNLYSAVQARNKGVLR